MITKAALLATLALAALLAVQTWRLSGYSEVKQRLDTCNEIRGLENDANNAPDDDLLDGISGGL